MKPAAIVSVDGTSSTPTRFYRIVRPPIPTVSLTEIVALCWDDDGGCAA